MPSNTGKIITYVPQSEEEDVKDMGSIRRGVWLYTNKLGLNFTLVLLLSLCYQAFMAIFIGMRGVVTLPILSSLAHSENSVISILGTLAAVAIAVIIQGLIIAEMAQVVWLRRPDRLKVRLMSDSIWWWIILAALIATIIIDFLLLFLAITSTNKLGDAWQFVTSDQMTGLMIGLLAILNLLTLLRCASVMRTSTSEEIRKEVEERLKAQAEEVLINASDATTSQAMKIYKKLSVVNPKQLIPLTNTVLRLVSEQHPDLIPSSLVGGVDWAYNPHSHSLAALPPDVHQALLQNRNHVSRNLLDDGADARMWNLSVDSMAELMSSNMHRYGQPKFIDVTNPEQPRYLNNRSLANVQFYDDEVTSDSNTGLLPENSSTRTANFQQQMPTQQSLQPGGSFVEQLPYQMKVAFAEYLATVMYPALNNGQRFSNSTGLPIFLFFDPAVLPMCYQSFQQYLASRQTQMQFQQQPSPIPPGFFGQ